METNKQASERRYNYYKYLDLPAPSEAKVGQRISEFGGEWEITTVEKLYPDRDFSNVYIAAQKILKDGSKGKTNLTYFTENPISSLHVHRN